MFQAGDSVTLVANPEEGWPEQEATVLGAQDNFPGMYTVAVHPDDEYDDGLREVHEDDMFPSGYRPCPHCGHCQDPDNCVWGVTCPDCGAGPSQQCTRPGGLIPLHKARWNLVKW